MDRGRIIFYGAVAIVFGVVLWRTYDGMIASPERELRDDIADLVEDIDKAERYNRRRVDVLSDLRALGDRTLGATREEVVHQLRVVLNEIATDAGLSEVVINSRVQRARENPADRVLERSMRRPADFVEVEGGIAGEGTFAAALAVVARLQSQAWPMRIERIRITPRESRDRVEMSLTLLTFYIPDQPPGDRLAISPIAEPELAAVADRLAGASLFSPPPAPPTPKPKPKPEESPKPKPKPAPPFGEWRITGFGEGRDGAVAYVLNGRSGESRALLVGEGVLNMVFRGLEGRSVVLELDGTRYYFGEGDSLAVRSSSPL